MTGPSTSSAQARNALGSGDVRQNIVRLNQPRAPFSDLYHRIIQMSWPAFLAMLVTLYFSANLFFASLYTLLGDVIAGSSGFIDNFFFSVQTFATIGYGTLAPKSHLANLVVVFESMSGIFGVAMLTGLMFAKFARPSARIFFASRVVINKRNGKKFLMLRVANERGSFVVEAEAHVTVIKLETTQEGETMRRVHDLKLVRNNQPWFVMSWMVMHEIDETSPLFGFTAENIRGQDLRLSINLMGLDASVGQTVHASASYLSDAIVFDHRYVDASRTLPDGRFEIDHAKLDLIEPQR